MKIKIDEIDIKIKLSDKEKLKATAVVDFGEITAKGFRLSVSEHENENLDWEKLWLQPPATKIGRFWHKIVWLNDKDKWRQLEKRVFDIYKEEQKKSDQEKEMHGDNIF